MTKRLSIRTAHRCFRSLANATGLVSANINGLASGSTHTRITSAKASLEKCDIKTEVLNGSAKYAPCTSMRLKVVTRKTSKPTISKISHCTNR